MGKRGRLLRNKRGVGEVLLMEAMQAVAIILILTGSMVYVNAKLAKIGLAKPFYARDAGLLTTTLYSASGNIDYSYYVDAVERKEPTKYKFQFIIADNFVKVNATESSKQNIYWYFSDFGTAPINSEESEILGGIKFLKEGNGIKMGKQISLTKNKILCSAVHTKDAAWRQNRFVMDPAHGENATDKGAVNNKDENFSESELTYAIAKRIGISEQNKIMTREKDVYASFAQRESVVKGNSNAVVISIHIGDEQSTESNYIKAYYNINSDEIARKKSSKLGCSILNAVVEYGKLDGRENIKGVAVIPSDSDYIKRIVPAGRVGVLLELGNIQIDKKDNFLADTTHLAEAIYTGIGNYYENE